MTQSPRKGDDTGCPKCGQPHRKEICCARVCDVREGENHCMIREDGDISFIYDEE